MAHEIMEHDNVILHKTPAWHGLGVLVEDTTTPAVACRSIGMDWVVEQWKLTATNDQGETISLADRVANIRSDTKTNLGVVSTGYKPVQNIQLAEFCEALAEQGDRVTIESAGSIRNGQKVWFLLKGESFSVRDKDEVRPYICVSNGHDGWTAVRATPTTIRVVCSNTLHMVIPGWDSEAVGRLKVAEASFTARHIGDIETKIESAKKALKLYGKSLNENRRLINQLAVKEVGREDVQRFFLECYTRDFGAIASVPTNGFERRQRDKAMDACNLVFERFDKDRDLAGATAWNMLNSYTGWLQHDRKVHIKDPQRANESRLTSTLFGENAERGIDSLKLALDLAS